MLYRAGSEFSSFVVILEGEVEVLRTDRDGGESLVIAHGPGRFLGELSLLTGQKAWLTTRVSHAGRILEIPLPGFRQLMASKPDLADPIFSTLVARREVLRSGDAALAVQILGSRYSQSAMALRAFAARNQLPHTWIDLEDADDADILLASMGLRPIDTPVVITPTAVLRHPTTGEFAEHLGLTFHSVPGLLFDLVVVGTGPAGLAASVYGASEGLVDGVPRRRRRRWAGGLVLPHRELRRLPQRGVGRGPHGQGGHPGHAARRQPERAVRGDRPAGRTGLPRRRLGRRQRDRVPARSSSPRERATNGWPSRTSSTTRAPASTTPRPTSRRGSATDPRSWSSAAATRPGRRRSSSLSRAARSRIAIRRDNLAASMSRYLIDRIEADPRIDLLTNTEVRALAGATHLEQVTIEHTPSRQRRTLPCAGLFCFIGAVPATGWLGDTRAARSGRVHPHRPIVA